MKTIQDYIQDAKNKVKIGLNAEHDYCVNKDKVRGTMCRAYAEASYKSARTAVKRAFALVGLTLPRKATTIHMLDIYLRVLIAKLEVFTSDATTAIENV